MEHFELAQVNLNTYMNTRTGADILGYCCNKIKDMEERGT